MFESLREMHAVNPYLPVYIAWGAVCAIGAVFGIIGLVSEERKHRDQAQRSKNEIKSEKKPE